MNLIKSCLFLLLIATQVFADDPIEHIQIVHNGDRASLHQFIIERSELEQSAALLSDILAQLPGVQIRKVSGFGNPATVSIRGSNSQQVNVYIDGQLVNSGQTGSFDLDQLPTSLIEKIEVNQSQSGGTGPTPIGGEIRITTIRPMGNSTSGYATFGSTEHIELNVKHQIQKKNQRLLASVHWLEAANNFSILIPQPFANSQVAQHQPLNNNQYSKLTGFLTHEIDLPLGINNINLQYDQQTKQIPNYQNNTPENHTNLDTKLWRIGNVQSWDSPLTSLQTINVDLTWTKQIEHYQYAPSPLINDRHDYQTSQIFAALKLPFKFDVFNWQPYVQFDEQTFESHNFVNQSRDNCNGYSQCDIYATLSNIHVGQQLSWRPQSQPMQINWSVNKTFATKKNEKRQDTDPEQMSTTEDYFSTEIDLNYQWQQNQLSLQLSKGFRAPNIYELFGDRGSFKGNDNLEPERSTTISLSSQHKIGNWIMQHSVYQQSMQDAIVAIFNASGTGSYQNISNVDLLGWSSNGEWSPNPNWLIGFTVDFIDSNTKSEYRSFNNKYQPGIYHQEYQSFIQWRMQEYWSFRVSQYYGRQLYYDRANKVTSENGLTSNKNSTDIAINYERDDYKISAKINNLMNQNYRDLSNKPAQGRQLQFTFTIKEI